MDELIKVDWNAMLPLGAALILSGLVGIERELRRKPAGLRTNILIGVGSALFTIIAVKMVSTDAAARIVQGIITGVGFIGAGVLIRQSGGVQGMTTAATIWLVTGIGVACGVRLYEIATAATALALIILIGLSPLDRRLHKVQDTGVSERTPDD